MSIYPAGTAFGDGNFWLYTSLYAGVGIAGIYALFLIVTNVWNKASRTAGSNPNRQFKDVSESTRSKIEDALFRNSGASAVEALSEIIDEEARIKAEKIRKEFADKYQSVVIQKNNELEQTKKSFNEVQEKFVAVEKNYKKIDTEKKQTEAVVRSIAEGLVVVNQKGEVLLMNPSAEKLLGVEGTKKIGKPILENMPGELMISMSKKRLDSDEQIIEYTSKDENVKKVVRSSSAVIQNEEGQTIGMVNILTDVTKQRELDGMKAKFVSNVTHELRTPIVTLQNAVAILNREAGTLTETQLKFLNIVSRSAGQLSHLVQDILDIAKIDSGKMQIKMKPAKLDKVITDACDILETWAKSKDIHITREIDKTPDMVFDPDKITQVLNNLISNAIKFTPQSGKITVISKVVPEKNVARVSVTDTGVGISQENLKKLFKRFEQFGDQEGIMGTGLGLAIVKEFVDRHGGEITVESEEQKGTTFTFTLPLKRDTKDNQEE